jgi:peptidyl-prolyl cis-trans isomerase B (cyclophilin B)
LVTMTIQGMGDIVLEMYPDKAPNTVRNFVYLANDGFYDGLIFHRVIDGFMIQGGDPEGVGTGGPGYSIKGEFAKNGFAQNDLSHVRGAVSMARSMDMDSAGSQFFIVQEDQTRLDGDYAVFGKVMEGMDIVDAIARVDTDRSDKPLTPVLIEKVTVDTGGEAIEKPEVIE